MRQLEFTMMIIHNLTTLVATEGIDTAVKLKASELIGRLMVSVIEPEITNMLADRAGIII